jgi:hypothetical protein
MAYSIAALAGAFKRIYPTGIEHLLVDESPLLGMIKKSTDFKGTGKELAWRVNSGGGVSADFATANTQSSQSTIARPYITRKKLYVVGEIDHESMEASEGNEGAIVTLLKELTENKMYDLKKRASSVLWGIPTTAAAGVGAIGQISAASNTGTATITLANTDTVINFHVGQRLCAFTTVAGGLLATGAVATLTAVNEDAGTLTLAGNWTASITGVAAGDYLVPEGDFNAVPTSVFAWNPITLPTTTSTWFGVDRANSIAMCGCRYAPTTGSIDEVLKDAMAKHSRQGGAHDTLILSPTDWSNLEKQSNNWQRINQNAVNSSGKKIADIGYNAIVLNGDKGSVNVFADPYLPTGYSMLTKLSSWEIWALNSPFRLLTAGAPSDGMVREATADSSKLRFGGYWNLINRRPRDSMVITLPAS